VTICGVTYHLPEPFMVMATQNPLESEGTYPLPEAQLDRFLFKLLVRFPTRLELAEIMRRTTQKQSVKGNCIVKVSERIVQWRGLLRQVPIATPVLDYAVSILLASHPGEEGNKHQAVRKYVRYGASPRGLQSMVLAAKLRAVLDRRFSVSREDIVQVAKPCLRHRILMTFEAESEGIRSDHLIEQIIQNLH
jgi:MoxR-like ATPase